VPPRSAKKRRPSGANASAVAKLAPIPAGGDCGPSWQELDGDVAVDRAGAPGRFGVVPAHATSSVVAAAVARRRRLTSPVCRKRVAPP